MSGERRQDARLEDAIEDGTRKVVEAAVGALGQWPWSHVIDAAAKAKAIEAARGPLLELLQLLGVDTSAHVTAPAVEVNVHRRPGHDEDV